MNLESSLLRYFREVYRLKSIRQENADNFLTIPRASRLDAEAMDKLAETYSRPVTRETASRRTSARSRLKEARENWRSKRVS